MTKDVQQQIEQLREEIRHHNQLYYVEARPEISDLQFDKLLKQLEQLEQDHPEYDSPDSPTHQVGGDPIEGFESVAHREPMLSIDNVYDEDFFEISLRAAIAMVFSAFLLIPFILTILVALATFAIIRVLSSFTVIYGRRMTGITILTAYVIGALLELAIGGGVAFQLAPAGAELVEGDTASDSLNQQLGEPVFVELGVIGYIIPGLIALWFNRQGILQTLSALIITSVLVRLTLIVLAPDAMLAYESSEISFNTLISRLFSGEAL